MKDYVEETTKKIMDLIDIHTLDIVTDEATVKKEIIEALWKTVEKYFTEDYKYAKKFVCTYKYTQAEWDQNEANSKIEGMGRKVMIKRSRDGVEEIICGVEFDARENCNPLLSPYIRYDPTEMNQHLLQVHVPRKYHTFNEMKIYTKEKYKKNE